MSDKLRDENAELLAMLDADALTIGQLQFDNARLRKENGKLSDAIRMHKWHRWKGLPVKSELDMELYTALQEPKE